MSMVRLTAILVLPLATISFLAFDSTHPVKSCAIIGIAATVVFAALFHVRQAFSVLERRNILYERMFDAMPVYAILLDRNLNILWTDKLFGDEFTLRRGAQCHEAFKGEPAPCADCPAQETFIDGEVHTREQRLVTTQGNTMDLLVYSAPLHDEAGEIVAALETAVNVTSVKEMQKQLILLGQTVAGMAHSIKNIMMGLDGGIYVVNRGLEANNQDEVKEGWDMVQLNFEKVSKLVQDILYCSKEREPEFRIVQPNKVIEEIHDLYRDGAAGYDIRLELDLDEKLVEAVIDPSGLHAVLANLVVNAMEACKVDLWKDTHLVRIRSRRGADGSAIMEVSDNGMGMDQELRDRAFDEFFSSKGAGGTGLGLMVTQKVVREHGGEISFTSAPGEGTTFSVSFPERRLDPA